MIAKRLVVIGFCMGLLTAPYTKTMTTAEINAKIADLQKKLRVTKVQDSKREIQSEIQRYQGMLGQPAGGGGGGRWNLSDLTKEQKNDMNLLIDVLLSEKYMTQADAKYFQNKGGTYISNLIHAAIQNNLYELPMGKAVSDAVRIIQNEAADALAGGKEQEPAFGGRETYPVRGVSRKIWNQYPKEYDSVITSVENLRSVVKDEAAMRALAQDITNATEGNWRAAGAEWTGISKRK